MALTLEKAFVLALSIILVTMASQAKSYTPLDETSIAQIHEQWMSQHGRNYLDSVEKEKRFQVFKENYKHIEKFNNAGNRTFKLGLNKFSDLTTEEFLASYTGLKMLPNPRVSKIASYMTASVPESFDWRDHDAVTDIKSQGLCGCCWAFSVVATIESAFKIKTGRLVQLSEQQLVDCNRVNSGCYGGVIYEAYDYIIQYGGGLASEYEYPYMARQGTCNQWLELYRPAARISGYRSVTPNNEQELKIAVYHQPVSVIMSVGQEFKDYKYGIFNGNCGNSLTQNHAVTIVGYGINEYGTKYWLIKNSWGRWWGENGYMRILRESDSPEGHCGLAVHPVYPVV